MKRFLISFVFLLTFVSLCAQENQETYYQYGLARIYQAKKKQGYQILFDNGMSKSYLKGADGQMLYFHTSSGALNYLASCGWQLDKIAAETVSYDTSGLFGVDTHTRTYYIMRKPCTKEELDSLVQKGIASSSASNE